MNRIIFWFYDYSTENSDIYMIAPDGTEIEQLTDTPEVRENPTDWILEIPERITAIVDRVLWKEIDLCLS